MNVSNTNELAIPEFALVLLVGASGSGKSTFARQHFLATEIVSSDSCRGFVSDEENNQEATADAFALLQTIVEIRLKRRRLTVVDATNTRPEDRKRLLEIARRCHALPVAIVIDPGESVCRARNANRSDRQFGSHVVRSQRAALRRSLGGMKREGFGTVHLLESETAIADSVISRQRLWTDRRDDAGPFDIIGDVHGCCDELEALLRRLGYKIECRDEPEVGRRYVVTPPDGRKAIFVGDLVDRGPRVGDTLRLAMDMVENRVALCVIGNHEAKVEKWLRNRDVQVKHGLDKTITDLDAAGDGFKRRVKTFIDRLVSHYMLDGGRLAVAHAGIKAEMQNRASGAIRAFCMYGETTGETDEFGLPVRHNWAADYRGNTRVIYGHTPVVETEWLNNTLCIDTGCVFGGRLSALRYPEMELVSEPARALYSEPARPLTSATRSRTAQQEHDDTLDLVDVTGKRILTTRYTHSITVREENAAAALEVMVRFAVDPRWLIYLPPTMSPSETSEREGYLEHPAEALNFYHRTGLSNVVCEEKHMGSRAILVLARNADVARRRFGVTGGEYGCVYTRTGRPFFPGNAAMHEVVARCVGALEAADLFAALDTDWLCLDAEIMPWSAKAQCLIEQQYGPVGAAARTGLALAHAAVETAAARGVDVGTFAGVLGVRRERIDRFGAAVRRYCWPVTGLDGLKIAPFHILAAEGRTFHGEHHSWHLTTLARLAEYDPLFQATGMTIVDLDDQTSVEAAIGWWLRMTEAGSEGMVIKPPALLVRQAFGEKGSERILQPAIKCRGRDYLRIIYGPNYDEPENLARLRKRGVGAKRSLAQREFVLGLEALDRFIGREPLRRVHECVFAILALESEPVDPRL